MTEDKSRELAACGQCGAVLRKKFNFCPACGRPRAGSRGADPAVGHPGDGVPAGVNSLRVGIFADVLMSILQDLNDHEELQRIFGVPVVRCLVVVADQNDLRIEDGGRMELSEEDKSTFLKTLDEIIRGNAV